MSNMVINERQLAQRLPAEGIMVGELHIGVQEWTRAQEGVTVEVSFGQDASVCHLWLAGGGWHSWCEHLLGTAESMTIDSLLLAGIAEWGLSPLLTACGAVLVQQNRAPYPYSFLPGQLAITFSWQIEQNRFQALLLEGTAPCLDAVVGHICPSARPDAILPPLFCGLYVGGCRIPLSELRQLKTGMGIRIQVFGNPREGEFALGLPRRITAQVRLIGEDNMQINHWVPDMDSLLDSEYPHKVSEASVSVDVNTLPQVVLVEVGQVEMALGTLSQLTEGDMLPVDVSFASRVTLRLNGQAIGQGELVGCGDGFLVRICRWYLNSDPVTFGTLDEVNTR